MTMRTMALAILAATAATPALAQVGLPGGLPGGLPSAPLPHGLPDRLPLDADRLGQPVQQVLQAPSRFRDLVRRSGGALEADAEGWPVVRAEILAIDLSADGRRAALAAGFTILREERLDSLGLTSTVLAPPARLRLDRALERLQDLDPEGAYALNHVLAPAGEMATVMTLPAAPASSAPGGAGALGLIDTGVDARHPALAGAAIRQRGFAGDARPAAHGTAVASLLVGRQAAFAGSAPGTNLFAADVYGGGTAGGSSTAVAQALAWLVENRVPVVNVSLVGPRNPLVEAAVRRAQARGTLIVAAVGNDGPAAPPLYPASYPGVVGVTAVNGRGRVLPEAGRGPQVDFAAPGADMAAAGRGEGYVSVRGASFAAPIVAGLLARRGGDEAAVQSLAASAADAGARGADPIYGRGVVGAELRVTPAAVGARGSLSR